MPLDQDPDMAEVPWERRSKGPIFFYPEDIKRDSKDNSAGTPLVLPYKFANVHAVKIVFFSPPPQKP